MANKAPKTDAERAALADVLDRLVRSRFDGKAKDAYTAAKVNSGTWTSLVEGKSTKPYIVVRVVNAFWPEAEGDWRRIPDIGIPVDNSTVFTLTADEAQALIALADGRAGVLPKGIAKSLRKKGLVVGSGEAVSEPASTD